MTQRDKPQLNYAPPSPMHLRKIVRRTLILGALLILALWMRRFGSALWQYAQVRYWQHRCLVYSPPADRIVFEDGLSSSPAPWQNAPAARSPNVQTSNGSALAGGGTPYERWCPLVGDPFYGHYFHAIDTVVFLHRRIDPSGRERLVMVRLAMRSSYQLWFHSASWPANGPGALSLDSRQEQVLAMPIAKEHQKLRLFAGQPDPADPTHFTIGYEIPGQPGIIDGWLRKNGVQLDIRNRQGKGP